jgi:hypothetical protein
MNPPHGEPGHRCDIPVGQPLNSKPAPVQQPVQQNMAQNAPAPTPAPTGPKPAVNPPHGEPWHDCAKKLESLCKKFCTFVVMKFFRSSNYFCLGIFCS